MIPLLSAMAARGHAVVSVNSGLGKGITEETIFFADGFSGIVSLKPEERVLEVAAGLEPDLLVTQGWGSAEAVLLAKELRVPCVLFIIDLIQLTDQAYCDYGLDFAANREIFSMADIVVANSHYTRKRVLELAAIDSTVIYPVIREEDFQAEERQEQGFATLAGATPLKGLNLLLEQAPRIPCPCLVCGDMPPEFAARVGKTPNVAATGHVDDMREVYSRTSCLLMLSQWEETFGRVMVEAHLNGIPVVALDRGAAREVAGKAAIYVSQAKDLPKAVKDALSIDPELCRENAARFKSKEQIDTFGKLVEMV